MSRWWPFGRPPEPPPPDFAPLAALGGVFKALIDRVIRLDAGMQRAQDGVAERLETLAGRVEEATAAQRDVRRTLDGLAEGEYRRLLLELVAWDADVRLLAATADQDPARALAGYQLAAARLGDVLGRRGVTAVEVADAPYDATWHEVVARLPGHPAGQVAIAYAPAYRQDGAARPLVRAKVAVGTDVPAGLEA